MGRLTPVLDTTQHVTIERVCRLARVSRAGYYRFWQTSAPRQQDTAARDTIQRLAAAARCSVRLAAGVIRRSTRSDLGSVVSVMRKAFLRKGAIADPRLRSI
jgi:putative transposase